MPSAPKLKQQPDTRVWYVHWTDPSPRGQRGRSRRQSTGTTDLPAAKAFFSEWLKLERGEAATGSEFTVADLWGVYIKQHVAGKVMSPERHDQAWKNLEPHFGALTPAQITNETSTTYATKRRSGEISAGRTRSGGARRRIAASDGTIRLELSLLVACFNWCSDKKRQPLLLDPAAVPYIELPSKPDPKDRWLTTDEIQRLHKAAREMRPGDRMSRVERFLWLALETASRETAIYTLDWSRVDFETDVIDYNEPGRRKTKKRRAVVPISKALRPVLKQMHDERENELVLGSSSDLGYALARVAKRAEVPDVTPHVLRHTAATHMARRGVPLWIIAKVLANTIAMVEKVYAKHCPDDLRSAVETITGAHMTGAEPRP